MGDHLLAELLPLPSPPGIKGSQQPRDERTIRMTEVIDILLQGARSRAVVERLEVSLADPLAARLATGPSARLDVTNRADDEDEHKQFLLEDRFATPPKLLVNLRNAAEGLTEPAFFLAFTAAHEWRRGRYGHAPHLRWGLSLHASQERCEAASRALGAVLKRMPMPGAGPGLKVEDVRAVTGIRGDSFHQAFLGRIVAVDELHRYPSIDLVLDEAARDLRNLYEAASAPERPA